MRFGIHASTRTVFEISLLPARGDEHTTAWECAVGRRQPRAARASDCPYCRGSRNRSLPMSIAACLINLDRICFAIRRGELLFQLTAPAAQSACVRGHADADDNLRHSAWLRTLVNPSFHYIGRCEFSVDVDALAIVTESAFVDDAEQPIGISRRPEDRSATHA